MPIQNKRLNGAQKREYLRDLIIMKAEGIQVDIPHEWQERSPLKITALPRGIVCDLCEGLAGYAIWIQIVSEARVIVVDYEMSSEWDEGSIELPFLTQIGGRYRYWQLDYAVKETLNDKLEEPLRFNGRGDLLEGVIIAYGLEAIPDKYQNGAVVAVRLTLTDSLGRTVSGDIKLQVAQRAAKRAKNLVRSGTGLYDAPKPQESNPSSYPSKNPELTLNRQGPCDGITDCIRPPDLIPARS